MPAGDPKHRAKRFNEGVKLTATLFNSLSIATVGAVFIVPIAQRQFDVLRDGGGSLLLVAVALHLVGQAIIQFTRAED
ncbi:hypothetical protein [Methylobacterium iners]|uniref:Uncharacterized protein n=1 Tax=Methylobacterium iners TaxID=418707 RepID=A0ABQ4RYB0_9HYPH|nr:hypothetical protein [Methylobacterium iners]GJD95825.1 hypothetical protein OCOJLMKI_3040 [Methylobacterium iners]